MINRPIEKTNGYRIAQFRIEQYLRKRIAAIGKTLNGMDTLKNTPRSREKIKDDERTEVFVTGEGRALLNALRFVKSKRFSNGRRVK